MISADTHLDETVTAMAGPGAEPRPDQRVAVRALVDDRARVLVVQATGWGKSAVYWAATRALRAAGGGYSIVVSPLLALMRDQIAAAGRAGLAAATVNSTNVEEWSDVLDGVRGGSVDVLLISPERLANPRFAAQLPALLAGCGLLVIDEAHCVSDWGFDFRPDYQRLTQTLLALAPGTPVLATTATANARVTEDVATQLGDDTVTLRGSLARTSLRLAVVPRLDGVQRAAWVADALGRLPGSGIVYVLTVAETDRVAGLLTDRGYDVAAYSSAVGTAEREALEDRLRRNEIKALVATSALGMGFDKPDLAFCIHVGSPASPVAYYQQVGRAGRALDDAVAVLLPSAGDERVWEYFATSGIPVPEHVDAVLGALAGGASSAPTIEAATKLRRGRVEALLKILAVDGVVARGVDGWAATGTPWSYDAAKWQALRGVREAEADLMRHYAAGDGCLMQFLQQALDDPSPSPCGRCSVCTGELPYPGASAADASAEATLHYLRTLDVELEPRKLWPSGLADRKGKIAGGGVGRALAFADDAAWSDAIDALGDGDGPVSAEIADAMVAVLSRWRRSWERPVVVVPMPSRRRPRLIRSLAEHIATVGKLPLVDALEVDGPPAPSDVASAARASALLRSMRVADGARLPPGPALLVDDTYRSGWTATVAAALLADAGATSVLPLVIHRLP
ncbi:MAG: ATP-dependent helicase, RecQ family [Desertimonas sp.]|nr:ATP-dependent helicase, RecQ family [Desertimonas sp.]